MRCNENQMCPQVLNKFWSPSRFLIAPAKATSATGITPNPHHLILSSTNREVAWETVLAIVNTLECQRDMNIRQPQLSHTHITLYKSGGAISNHQYY